MSAAKGLNIEQAIRSTLPPEALLKAKLLAGELAWSAEDAIEVIKSLANSGYPVTGVELWQDCKGAPKWVATSDYSYSDKEDSEQHITLCTKGAIDFVRRFQNESGTLFNLS